MNGPPARAGIDLPLSVGRKNRVRVAAPRASIAAGPGGWRVPAAEVRCRRRDLVARRVSRTQRNRRPGTGSNPRRPGRTILTLGRCQRQSPSPVCSRRAWSGSPLRAGVRRSRRPPTDGERAGGGKIGQADEVHAARRVTVAGQGRAAPPPPTVPAALTKIKNTGRGAH